MEKTVLAVGDSTRLEIIFGTRSYKTRINKRPRIQTNEGPPDKNVRISAHVTPRPDSTWPIVINPYKVDLSQFTTKKITQKSFAIENVSDQELKITVIDYPKRIFELKVPESVAPGSTAEGYLVLHDDWYEESFDKSFTIDNKTRFTVPVRRQYRNVVSKGTKTVKGSEH